MTMTASKLLRLLEETTAAGLVPTGTDERQLRPLLQQAPLCGLQPTVARESWLGPSVSMHKGQLSEEAREQEVVAGQSFSQPQRFVETATKQSYAEEQRFGTSEIHFLFKFATTLFVIGVFFLFSFHSRVHPAQARPVLQTELLGRPCLMLCTAPRGRHCV